MRWAEPTLPLSPHRVSCVSACTGAHPQFRAWTRRQAMRESTRVATIVTPLNMACMKIGRSNEPLFS